MRGEKRGAARFILRPSSFILAAAITIAAIAATPAFALDVPPSPTQWLTDRAALLPSDKAEALNAKLRDFEQQSGAQFLIYIFPSLEGEAIEDFTIRCAEKWKVGQKKYDNGLILFVFVTERKIRVEVGYGLEGSVTDAYSSRVIREYIAPHFQQGDWAGGLNAGADALMAKIRGGEAPVPPNQPSRGAGDNGNATPGSVLFFIVLFVIVFFILPLISRRQGCGGCFWPMFLLGGGGNGITFGGRGGGFGGGFGGGGFGGGGGGFGGGGATGGW